MTKEIIVYESYPENYSCNIAGIKMSHNRIGVLMETIKGIVGECIIRVHKCPTIEDYERLKSTGMLFEFHPEATGIYDKDKHLLYKK